MELAPTRQAMRLEPPVPLADVTERVRDAAALCHDHPSVRLGSTRAEYDGTWRFNGKAGRLSRHAMTQLCSRLSPTAGGSIPIHYLARCPAPLAAENLNYWLSRPEHVEAPVLVRTRERGSEVPTVRAVLSDRYAVIDHLPLLELLHEMAPRHHLHVQGWALDDEHLTLRLTFDREHPASLADPIRVGIHLTNSEVGLAQVSVMGLVTRLVCSNGLVIKLADLGGVQRRHVGRRSDDLARTVLQSIPEVMEEAEEAAVRFIRLRDDLSSDPVESFLKPAARDVQLPEPLLPAAIAALEGDSRYDAINAITFVAQRLPVTERVRIETAMSQFLRPARRD